MNREIKFRVWDVNGDNPQGRKLKGVMICNEYLLDHPKVLALILKGQLDIKYELMQFTGLKDKNGKEIYEGDIFRVEEDSNDDIFYITICWIQEWTMFTTLHAQEYKDYLEQGVNVLDESLFWTYTLKDTDDRRYFLCGNIHSNPELLK